MNLHRFMEIDICPLCGGEIFAEDNEHLGKPDVNDIPGDTTFVIPCVDEEGFKTCGEFRISRIDPTSLEDDWKCEYVLV